MIFRFILSVILSKPQYLTKIIKTKSIPGKTYGNSRMVNFSEINQAPPPTKCCSILQE